MQALHINVEHPAYLQWPPWGSLELWRQSNASQKVIHFQCLTLLVCRLRAPPQPRT